MAWQTILRDEFTAANGTTLAGRSPSPTNIDSLTWSTPSGLGDYEIQSNRAQPVATADSAAIVTLGGGRSGQILAVQSAFTSTATNNFLVFRWVDASNYWRVANSGVGTWRLTRVVAGTITNLITAGTVADNDVMRIEIDGDDISLYQNGLLLDSVNDSTHSSSLSFGLRGTAATRHQDDFQIEFFSAGPSAAILRNYRRNQLLMVE